MENCIELLRCGGGSNPDSRTTTGVIGFCDFATHPFIIRFGYYYENIKKTPKTIFSFFGQLDSHSYIILNTI